MSGNPHLRNEEPDLASQLVGLIRRYLLVMIAIVVVLAVLTGLQLI